MDTDAPADAHASRAGTDATGDGGDTGGGDTGEWWHSDSEGGSDEEVDKMEDGGEADPLYDEEEDEQAEAEVEAARREEQGRKAADGASDDSTRLACPCCFTTLCTDCQRHGKYKNQWRAMFVENCTVQTATRVAAGGGPEGEAVSPVECSSCGAGVGVLDADEVYHFFGVIPEGV